MIIKFNEDNIKKLRNKTKRLGTLALSGVLSLSLLTGCNKSLLDTKFGFNKALILGEDTSIIMDIAQWKDYSGEQLQLITKDNFVLLSSSFDTNMFFGESTNYDAESFATGAISSEGELHQLGTPTQVDFNKDIFDTQWTFNRAITFNGSKALVLPVKQWKDYEGEQLQIITEDGLVLNLCSFNTKLVYDKDSSLKASDFAQCYIGQAGSVTDLTQGDGVDSYNHDIIDTKFGFNKAIILKDKSALILPISKWCDYEGEQLQLKITDGPTIVTASYDTILVNDIESPTKAKDIASSLADKVVDYTDNLTPEEQISFNKTIIDTEYGFANGIVSHDNSATAFPIDKWNDYEGEQLQVKLASGDVILVSSMLLDLINGGNDNLNASNIASAYVDQNGQYIDYSAQDSTDMGYNKYVIDTELKFKYALKIINGNVTIIPIKKWQDFYNNDGNKNKDSSSNCEQLQLTLPDDTVIVTTAYDTVLVNNQSDIKEIAKMFKGPLGHISDLTPYVGEAEENGWNFSFFDTNYVFSYAIMTNDSTAQVMPIKKWQDYSDGEQLQLKFNDDSGLLTSFVNTMLVAPNTVGIEETLASAFNGTLEEDKSLIKVYK